MITEEEVQKSEQEWEKERNLLNRKYKIKQEKRQLKNKYKQLTTTKLLILFLFISCTIIEIFTGWVTIQSLALAQTACITPDFSPLVGLIGAVVGEVFSFGIYAVKSLRENSQGGIVYEQAMKDQSVG